MLATLGLLTLIAAVPLARSLVDSSGAQNASDGVALPMVDIDRLAAP
jgi:hypothetical protein